MIDFCTFSDLSQRNMILSAVTSRWECLGGTESFLASIVLARTKKRGVLEVVGHGLWTFGAVKLGAQFEMHTCCFEIPTSTPPGVEQTLYAAWGPFSCR